MTDTSSPTIGSESLAGPRVSRRKFISGMAMVVATAVVGALGVEPDARQALLLNSPGQKDGWLTLCTLSSLAPGVPSAFPFARKLRSGWNESQQTGIAYAVTRNGGDIRVFANVCTHGGCRVAWQQNQQAFVCPCHDGCYGLDGEVLAGLPPRPLEQFPCRVANGLVQIRLDT